MTKPCRAINLMLDFDGTLTHKDTTTVIGNISETSRTCWDKVLNGWLADYEVFKQQKFDWKTYDNTEYGQWLNSRKWLEIASAQRAQDCGMFEGVTHQDINSAVAEAMETGDLSLRDGWEDLIRLALDSKDMGSKLSIISVSWSESFIRKVLHSAASDGRLAKVVNDMEIHANEIQGLGSPAGSSGRLTRPFDVDLRTSGDKLRYFVVQTADHGAGGGHPEEQPITIYVGDSSTDFECLCRADIGIWTAEMPREQLPNRFLEVFKPLQASTPQVLADVGGLSSFVASKKSVNESSMFYWAPDLLTIIAFLTN